MKNKSVVITLTLAGWTAIASAQSVTPVFEHLYTKAGGPLPILKAQGVSAAADDRFDGTSPMDSYGAFKRYDANRLLLAIRENGINESDPAHNAALAAQYPDRSLIWIDPATGAPMGVALRVGLNPVPLDADFLAAGGTLNDFYFTFGIAADGVLYVGYKNKILRYAPSGASGFGAPTVAYTQTQDGSERWHQWRWENIRVRGGGAETVIMAGGKTWRPNQGYHILATIDGINFTKVNGDLAQNLSTGGGASSLIQGRNRADATEEWVYRSLYPGSSNGIDSRFNRSVGSLAAGGLFSNDSSFAASRDPNADPVTEYVTEFISDVDGDGSLGYVVAYSTPSWNSKAVNRLPTRPGFLALHSHNGDVLASYTLNVKEDAEIVGDPAGNAPTSQFYGTLGSVEVNVLPGMKAGQAEVIWYSGIYGYGRYLVSGPPVTPVFEHLYTKAGSPLPILKAQGVSAAADDRFDGTSPMDSYGAFKRYDANRLLLAIRENGINESDPAHNAALAAQYPDRSLIWIDPATGAPMGMALRVGLNPVPLDADFLAAGGTLNDFYFTFGVAADGVLYVGYKNKILRYAPSGASGFGAPTVAYTQTQDGSERWHQWRWENIRVRGGGPETVIMAGGKTWRPNQGYHILVTTDGINFTKVNGDLAQNLSTGGGASSLIQGRNRADATEEWVYRSLYPGSSNGIDSRFNRSVGSLAAGGLFSNDSSFAASRDPNADPVTEYVTEFISDVDGDGSLGYVVAYSTPSWNSKAVNRLPTRPGFLALHSHSGDVLSTYTLNVKEDAEIVGDPAGNAPTSQFYGTLGSVEVNVLPGMKAGQAEVIWYSGIYGYGRYLVGVASAAPQPVSLTATRAADGKVVIAWEGPGTLEAADTIGGVWSAQTGATSPLTVTPAGTSRFYRVRK